MKHSIAFILILLSSTFTNIEACAPYFYPSNEEIRFSVLNPAIFSYPDLYIYNYTAHNLYGYDQQSEVITNQDSIDTGAFLNIQLWQQRCGQSISVQAIYEGIYTLDINDKAQIASNPFWQYFYKNKQTEVITYLKYVKECEPYNTHLDDPWERYENARLPHRTVLINQGLQKIKTLQDEDLKRRYAFAVMKLAYYNDQYEIIKTIYSDQFENHEPNTIIDYWAMYYRAIVEPSSALRNYYCSVVFMNAPDKRFNIHQYYDKTIDASKTVSFANTSKDKAAVWFLAGIKSVGRAFEYIQNLQKAAPNSPEVSFLLLRETNKLEDWIYTPYYTLFEPSLDYNLWGEEPPLVYPQNQVRIAKDRMYAKRLLNFVNTVKADKTDNPMLWKTVQSYLCYMSEDFNGALKGINAIQKAKEITPDLLNQINILKILCLTSRQPKGKAVLLDEVKNELMSKNGISDKCLFAIARELEYKGNTTDAAILLSKINGDYEVSWKSRKNHFTTYVDFYSEYFFYLDAQYTTAQLQALITNIEKNKDSDGFNKWYYAKTAKDISRLYDLLGTKYLRENKLNIALANYGKVNDTLWNSPNYAYKDYLNANPFYADINTEHETTIADTIRFNKKTILEKLIYHLAKAQNRGTKDKDYHYFLAANCYFNMTQYGNSWMMKRYFWTIHETKTNLADDPEYFSCNLAKQYYLKAKSVSINPKFAALCLRMAGRCEKYKLLYTTDTNEDQLFSRNMYYRQLKKQYPAYYDDLMSNCESFNRYFTARN